MSTKFSAEPGATGKRCPAPVVRGEDTLPPVPGSQADGDPVITEAQRKLEHEMHDEKEPTRE